MSSRTEMTTKKKHDTWVENKANFNNDRKRVAHVSRWNQRTVKIFVTSVHGYRKFVRSRITIKALLIVKEANSNPLIHWKKNVAMCRILLIRGVLLCIGIKRIASFMATLSTRINANGSSDLNAHILRFHSR